MTITKTQLTMIKYKSKRQYSPNLRYSNFNIFQLDYTSNMKIVRISYEIQQATTV